MKMRLFPLIAALAFIPCLANAAPPPPAPDYISRAARTLIATPSEQTFDSYASSFADDVRVFVDGREVASDKRSWLELEKARLGRVERRIVGYALGSDNVLVVDEFDDRSALPGRPGLLFDPRFVTRAARYQFGPDHLIHELRFVQGGGFWMRGDTR